MTEIGNIFLNSNSVTFKEIENVKGINYNQQQKASNAELPSVEEDSFAFSKNIQAAADLRMKLYQVKKEQGLIGKAWDGIKNVLHLGASSNKVEKALDQLAKGEISEEEAKQKLEKYTDGQKMCVDVVADMVSGIVAVGAAMAAPFTGGASLLVAAGAGAVLKTAIKGGDALVGKRKYGIKDFAYDTITGSVNGLMAPLTNALGGAAGTGVAKACGLNVAKSVASEGAEAAGKGFLSRLLAKQGAEYVLKEGAQATAKTTMAKVAAYGVDMAVDGAISGAADGLARSVATGDTDNIGKNVKEGFIGGLIAAPIIGGGFKLSGKAAGKIANKFAHQAAGTASEEIGEQLAREVSGEVGETVGEQTTKGVAESIAEGIGSQTGKEAAENIAEEIGSQTGKEAAESIAEGIGSQTGKEAAESVAEEVGSKTGKEAAEQVGASSHSQINSSSQQQLHSSPNQDTFIKQQPSNVVDSFEVSTSPTTPAIPDPIQEPPKPTSKNHSAGVIDTDIDATAPDTHSSTKPVSLDKDPIPDAKTDTPSVDVKTEASVSYKKGVQDKISYLKKHYTSYVQDFTVNGKKVQFEIFKGSQGGTNNGYYALNKSTGELFYAKFSNAGSAQTQTEILASKIYKLAGIDAPELSAFTAPDGSKGLLSKFIPNLEAIKTPDKSLNEGFAMDAFLANWDAVCSDNAVTNGNGAIRIDVGGTFDFRAQGGKKSFTSIVDEITTLADSNYNPTSAKLFSTMTRDDLIVSLKKVVDIDDEELIKLLKDQNMLKYKDVLLKRKAFLADLLQEVEKTSDTGMSMKSYLQKVKWQTFGTSIENASSLQDLQDIQSSINHVQSVSIKKTLQDKLDNKKLELDRLLVHTKGTPINKDQLPNLLKGQGFKKNSDGTFSITLPTEYKNKIINKYGASTSSKIIYEIEKPLTYGDLANIAKLMNVCDSKYTDILSQDMRQTIAYYRILRNGSDKVFTNFDSITPAQWDAIMNTLKYKVPIDTVEALANYKGSSHSINTALTKMKKDPNYVPDGTVKGYIDAITSYIDTQAISEPITVYRGEGYEVLHSVNINGTTLDVLMKDAASCGDNAKINALIDMVEQNNYVATQERFMSTSLLKNSSFHDSIIWELTMPKGSKGVFLEGANITGTLNSEVEYLVQRGSKIRITEMSYNHNGKWYLKGTLVN